jgi:pimeloyl-ACP methyl ester carboxylesterase
MGPDEQDTEASKNQRKGLIDFFNMGNDAVIKEMEKESGKPLTEQDRRHYSELDLDAVTAVIRNNEHLGYEEFLPRVKTPTLLYCGDKDYFYPSANKCVKIMPNARLIPLPGLDHGGGFDRVDLVLPHVQRFLDTAG